MKEDNDIKQFYKGKRILITGASGFIGKVLLWKLLHSCSSIDKIYVLLRSKHGEDVQTRLGNTFQAPIYDEFRQTNPSVLEKVIAIAGDIAEDGLGISDNEKDMLISQVNVVFHIAAALNMNVDLKTAINMNTTGTMRMCQFASKMNKLEVFVHTSTAYCYCEREVTEEEVFPPQEDPYSVMQMTRWMSPELLETISPKLIKPHPNTYTYTKRLAEKLVADHYPQIPVVIARPSIVIPSLREPTPGWVDNVNGPIGFLMAAGKGVCRSMLCVGSSPADMVTVDVVCNGLIVFACKASLQMKHEKPNKIPVLNITSTETELLLWDEIIDLGKRACHKYPFSHMLWYPGGDLTSNRLKHEIVVFLFQMIPAYFLDLLFVLCGQKPFLVNVQMKLKQAVNVLIYFTTRSWKFSTHNLMQLKASMSASDQEEFPVTMKGLDRLGYIESAVLGTRIYILKDDPSTLPQSRKKLRTLYIIDCIVRFLGILLLLWFCGKMGASIINHFGLNEEHEWLPPSDTDNSQHTRM